MHVITGLNDGGAEAVLYRLICFDKNYNHKVISLLDGGKYRPLLDNLGVEVVSVGMQRGIPSLFSLYKLYSQIKKFQPDLVQTWMYHADFMGGICARLAGVDRIVWGIHNTTLTEKSGKFTKLITRANALLSKHLPKKIICCAASSKSVHQKLGYDKEKMVIVPNGYDMSTFDIDSKQRASIRKEFSIGHKMNLFGMVARFDQQKDHENLLASLAELKRRKFKFKVLLVGTDMDLNNAKLINMIKHYDIETQTTLLGQRDDVPAIMNALDVHILSSGSGEAFPNVVCEAMACGTICVVTDVGDSAYIVGEIGEVAPPKEPIALADAIERSLLNARNLDTKKTARNRIAQNFSVEAMVSNYGSIWDRSK